MSDIPPNNRSSEPSPAAGEPGKPSGESRDRSARDDQPTVISNRPLMSAPRLSDSACRILQGKILPGDRLEHFELVQYVGGGGMGRVFRGVDTRLQRDVALKVLSPDQAADAETLLRFQNEAQSAARLDHENIARVYHVGEDRGLHYIAFEFIEGVNTRDLVEQKGPLPLAEAIKYTLQVAEALTHADARNVVHRDIKPSNLLITPEGQVKLIDMGLARLKRLDRRAAELTASGVTLGTFDYIAPEQARDPRSADVRSDIYSLGCTLFFMLTARPPFPEGTVLQKLLQHQSDEPPDIRQFRPDLPDEVVLVLRKMLAKDPRHRHRDSVELVDELRSLAHQVGLHLAGGDDGTMTISGSWLGSRLRRHLPWITPVAGLILAVVVLHFFPSRGDPSPPPWPAARPAARWGSPQPSEVDSDAEPSLPGEAIRDVPPEESGRGTDGGRPRTPSGLPPPGPAERPPGTDVLANLPSGSTPQLGSPQNGQPPGGGASPRGDDGWESGVTSSAFGSGTDNSAEPGRSGLLIVTDNAQFQNEFPTLKAACNAAVDGDIIELQYNGRGEEEPITLDNVSRLTIRASENYQPIVVFEPYEADLLGYSRSMISVIGGRLTLLNLALELYIPRFRDVPAESWSLFETQGDSTIRLEECSLSVCNATDQLVAYDPGVAFFRVRSAPATGVVSSDSGSAAVPPATIRLSDCVARGEAVFLYTSDLQPISLWWENGLLVTTEQLLWARGTREDPLPGEKIQVDLRNLTAVMCAGLCRMTQTPAARSLMDVQIDCTYSILRITSEGSLIEQDGVEDLEDLRQKITWTGDRNFYDNDGVFWSVRDAYRQNLRGPMTFAEWRLHSGSEHEIRPTEGNVYWQQPPDFGRAMHTHTPADYRLAESTPTGPNPARDAGFRAAGLPQHPAPSETSFLQ